MTQKLDKSAKVISNMFTSLAPRYDLMNDIMTGFIHRYTRKFALKLTEFSKDGRALDLATGTGDFAFLLHSLHFPNKLVIGCDFSKGMLEVARNRMKIKTKESTDGELFFLNSDINFLPFTDRSFDVCSILYGIRNVANPHQVLKEINRVTKKSGRLIVVESALPSNRIARSFITVYFRKIVPKLALFFSSNVQAYEYYFSSVKQFLPKSKFLKLLKQTNWKKVYYFPLICGSLNVYQVFKK